MATPRYAQVIGVEVLGPDTRLVELQAEEALGFVGGQYIIVDSGLVLPNGKAAKRAYSLLTADSEQRRFQLAVKRIPDGRCSAFIHALEPGATVRFSGPWGKFRAPEGAGGRHLVLATDTGVTAALGLLRSERFAPLLPGTWLVWLRVTDDFVSEIFVRERVPGACGGIQLGPLPPVNHPERLPRVRAFLRNVLADRVFEHAFLSGDGAINHGLVEDLRAAGIPVGRDNLESFFNIPKKKSR